VRAVLAVFAIAGCAELGGVGDGTSVSVGKPSNGRLVAGARLPDRGEGYTTSELWLARGARYGTDELVDLVVGVARRMQMHAAGTRLVVADLSGQRGGEEHAFHRSHQSGRDADLVFYQRDAAGKAFEPETMRPFDARGVAVDGSGITIDIPRTWQLVAELLDAPEATVQWIFVYDPIAKRLIDHAEQHGASEELVARARKALRQPGDSARHDDHMHVRIYCSEADKTLGCVDIGPMELLAERQAKRANAARVATPDDAIAPAHAPIEPRGAASLRRARPDRLAPGR
jgi:penicillin-insensitive murein endopeptidase